MKRIQMITWYLYLYVKFTFCSNLFENTDSTGRFTRYVSNVVLNVKIFLFVISIATPFSFEIISENVSKILGIQGNSDYYLLPTDMSNLLFKAISLKILIPQDDLQDMCRMWS